MGIFHILTSENMGIPFLPWTPCVHGYSVLILLVYTCSAVSLANMVALDQCPFAQVRFFVERSLGQLRYLFTNVPPQSNSPLDIIFRADHD